MGFVANNKKICYIYNIYICLQSRAANWYLRKGKLFRASQDIFNTKGFIDEDSRKKYNFFNMSYKCINNLYSVLNHYEPL